MDDFLNFDSNSLKDDHSSDFDDLKFKSIPRSSSMKKEPILNFSNANQKPPSSLSINELKNQIPLPPLSDLLSSEENENNSDIEIQEDFSKSPKKNLVKNSSPNHSQQQFSPISLGSSVKQSPKSQNFFITFGPDEGNLWHQHQKTYRYETPRLTSIQHSCASSTSRSGH